ncbi:MAG TPA: hypothetical protein VI524_05045 [Anaerolineales bacterium]|nr:hypothetical protein [Anaerolineales bacterium]
MTFLYDAVRTWASGVFGATSQQIDYWGVWVFVGSVVIFMFISTIQDLIKETSRAKIMSVGRPVWEPKGFKGNELRDALYIEFKNVGGDAARVVHAVVKWKTMQGELRAENNGRWHITNRQIELGHPLQSVDMYPNEEVYRLHFAIKSSDGKDMYAWYRVRDEQGEMFKLADKSYRVEITLTDSQRSSWKFKYPVENEQKSQRKVDEQITPTVPRKKKRSAKKVDSIEDSPIPVNKSSVIKMQKRK